MGIFAWINQRDIGNMDGGFALLNTALRFGLRRADMTFDHIDAIDNNTVFLGQHLLDLAAPTFVAPRDNDYLVVLFDPAFYHLIMLFLYKRLENLRRQRNNLHVISSSQLARNRAKNSRADWLALWAKQNGGITIKTNCRAVVAPDFLGGAHDNRAVNLALLYLSTRDRLFDRYHY